MKIAKLHLVPALLFIAAVKLEIVASQYNEFYDGKLGRVLSADFINQLALKGQTSNPTCKPDTSTESTSPEYGSTSYTDHPEHSTATDAEVPESHFTTEDLPSTGSYHSTARSLDYNYDSPVSSNGRNVEQNTANAIYMARNQQTNRIRRRNPSQRRRRENRRRRPTAQRRRRPSAQRRRRRNRNNSKDRRRRRREEQRKQPRRVIVRRRNANKRNNGQRNERSQL